MQRIEPPRLDAELLIEVGIKGQPDPLSDGLVVRIHGPHQRVMALCGFLDAFARHERHQNAQGHAHQLLIARDTRRTVMPG